MRNKLGALALVAVFAAAPARAQFSGPPLTPGSGGATPQGPLGFTPPKVINVTDPPYGAIANSPTSAAANFTAFQGAAAVACATAGGAKIALPAGAFYVALQAGQAAIPIDCNGVSIEGAGGGSTMIYPSGNGDLIDFTPPSASKYGGWASVSGFRVYRSDNPASGRGLLLDHASGVNVRDVEIAGMYIDGECNACLNANIHAAKFDGTNSSSGSTLFWVHHTDAYPTTTTTTTTTTIPVNSTANVYYGQVVTGDANIPAGSYVVSWILNTSITISATPTGTVGSGESLTLTDANPANTSIGGMSLIQSVSGSPSAYAYALKVQDVDGLWLGDIHAAWANAASLYVQPQYPNDTIDNILSTSESYFDKSPTGCIDFEPYGGFTTTAAAATAASATTVTLSSAAPSTANGWYVLADGVNSGTTVSSGQGTTSITLNAGANSLGIASGAAVTLYPAFSGVDTAHTLDGFCQGAGVQGALFNDPALTRVVADLHFTNAQGSALVVNAGLDLDFSHAKFSGNNLGNSAAAATAMIQGNASFVRVGGAFGVPGQVSSYLIDIEGQADHITWSESQVVSQATTSDIHVGGLGTHIYVSPGVETPDTTPNAPTFRSSAGQAGSYIIGKSGETDAQFSGGSSSTAWPVLQSGGGVSWQIYGSGTGATTGKIDATASTAGTLDLGPNGDTISLGSSTVLANIDFAGIPYSTSAPPSIAANACGSTTQGSVSGADTDGKLTVGTASVTSCAVSFSGTLPNAPRAVVLTPANSTAAGSTGAYVSAISTTSWTLSGTALSGAAYYYHVE
ncbi:MAG: hypothetical protein ACLPN5_23545 [Roseiarcus sp.]